MGEEFFVAAEIGAGFEVVDQGADAGKVVRGGELGDDEGEVAAVEGEVRGEGGGAADVVMRSDLVSDLRRWRALRVFCVKVRRVEEFGERMEVE